MAGGKFITLEGGEGAGKSTQAKKLAAFLRKRGHKVVLTREVGGAPGAEEIRKLWLGKGEGYWDGLTEIMLISAARREHLVKTIWPALKKGAWVISDRFADSTMAYQGTGLKLNKRAIEFIYFVVAGDFEPDLTLLLDTDVKTGLKRMAGRSGKSDRYEQKAAKFHMALRKAYLALAREHKHRFAIVDASGNADDVARGIERAVVKRLQPKGGK